MLTSDDFGPDPSLPIVPPGHDYLAFAATVWNAGTSPLVVEGSRAPGADLMQARQYFYDRSGRQLGWIPVGSMAYDPKLGHQHWHFLDFASTTCSAVPSSSWCAARRRCSAWRRPTRSTCCARTRTGSRARSDCSRSAGRPPRSASGRALDVGWGDTYGQFLPGQSFDITDLANGAYFIQVLANPEGNLYETDLTNNESLRRIILGGKPGHRTVKAPPYLGNDVP